MMDAMISKLAISAIPLLAFIVFPFSFVPEPGSHFVRPLLLDVAQGNGDVSRRRCGDIGYRSGKRQPKGDATYICPVRGHARSRGAAVKHVTDDLEPGDTLDHGKIVPTIYLPGQFGGGIVIDTEGD
jgi:hypothetical protein